MTPSLSVIVSTRNRPDQIVDCVRSILANDDPDLELVIVDQSAPDQVQRACAEVGADPRLRWQASATRGLSASRNVGLAATSAPVIAFTDDDCRVPANWTALIRAAFARDSDLSMLFGAVVLTPEDRARGYAAEFEPSASHEFRRTPPARMAWGVGANMAMRRTVFDAVGVFDTQLGAGAPFHAGEEIDLTLRALGRTLKIRHEPAIAVLHLGVRTGAAASHIMRGYGDGLGATLAKHVRLRTPGAARFLAHWLTLHGRRVLGNVLRGHRNPGIGLVAAVAWGAARSCAVPVNAKTLLFDARR